MNQPSPHMTFRYKLNPTPKQADELERVLLARRHLSNAALERRIIAWRRRHVSISRFEQEAEPKDIRAECGEYAAIQSHILQEALAWLDMTYQAYFRRMRRGERAGFSRFKGRNRFHSFTNKEF